MISRALMVSLAWGFFLATSSWAAPNQPVPLYKICEDQPLLYLRAPLPWARPALPERAQRAFCEALISSLGKSTPIIGHPLRQILRQSRAAIELLVLEPNNPYLPIPSFVLKIPTRDPDATLIELESIIRGLFTWAQGSPASWIRFQDKNYDGQNYKEAFLLAGRLWLQNKDGAVCIYYSNRADFLSSLNGSGQELEKPEKLHFDDLFLHLTPKRALDIYHRWLKRYRSKLHDQLMNSALVDLESFNVSTAGRGSNFSFHLDGTWTAVPKRHLSPLAISEGEDLWYGGAHPSFGYGGVSLPALPSSRWKSIMAKLSPQLHPALHQLVAILLTHTQRISFSWPQRSVSPIFHLKMDRVDSFERSLANIQGGFIKRSLDKSSGERHLHWSESTLSYRILNDGLLFSPLRHALEDLDKNSESTHQSSALSFHLPLSGRTSNLYYVMMQVAITLAKGSSDPNTLPAFSSLGIDDASWSAEAQLSGEMTKEGFQMRGQIPYGIAGILGGYTLQSSHLAYVLSLVRLTEQSLRKTIHE